jgi:hypothetical protein
LAATVAVAVRREFAATTGFFTWVDWSATGVERDGLDDTNDLSTSQGVQLRVRATANTTF